MYPAIQDRQLVAEDVEHVEQGRMQLGAHIAELR
jgi:hypothetical protein